MVMKSYYKVKKGKTLTTVAVKNVSAIPGTDPPEFSSTWDRYTNQTESDAWESILNVQLTSSGDFKRPNGHAYEKFERNFGRGSAFTGDSSSSFSETNGLVGPSAPYDTEKYDEDFCYNVALSKTYNQLRDGVDLSISVFEAGQTRRMIKQVMKLTNYVRSFSPKNWGNKWLEYQYGWRPLVQDVYKTADLLLNHVSQRGIQVVRDRYGSRRIREQKYTSPARGAVTFVNSTRCEIITRFRLEESAIQNLANYTSLNPLSIAWELMPYSFVADWVYNVGGYINDAETAYINGTRFVDGTVSFGSRNVANSFYSLDSSAGSYQNRLSSSSDSKFTSFRRFILTEAPYPRPPVFKISLGSERLLSAASLLSQHLGVGGRLR